MSLTHVYGSQVSPSQSERGDLMQIEWAMSGAEQGVVEGFT